MESCLFKTSLTGVSHSYPFSREYRLVDKEIFNYLKGATAVFDSKALFKRITALTDEERYMIWGKLNNIFSRLNPGTWDKDLDKYQKLFVAFHPAGKNSSCTCSFAKARDWLSTSKRDLMIGYLNTTKKLLFDQFASSIWTEDEACFSISNAFDNAICVIRANPTMPLLKYKKVFSRAVLDLQDYHTSARFNSVGVVFLPFEVKSAKNRYFISAVLLDYLPKDLPQICPGDEILEYDGKLVQIVGEELRKVRTRRKSRGYDQSKVDGFLTTRKTEIGFEIPKRPIKLKLRSKVSGVEHMVTLPWCTGGKETELVGFDLNSTSIESDYPPLLGKKIWEADGQTNVFDAYTFATKKGVAGYVRLDSFSTLSELKGREYKFYLDKYLSDFSDVVQKMQKSSSLLVIDLRNNNGGDYLYSLAFVSMLIDQPLMSLKHRAILSKRKFEVAKDEIQHANDLKSKFTEKELQDNVLLCGYPVTLKALNSWKSYHKTIREKYLKNKKFSSQLPDGGIKEIEPSKKAQYSKPILFLVNEGTCSAAECMAKTLQAHGRAKVFGTNTPGMNGEKDTNSLNCKSLGIGIEINFSTTVALKEDGTPDETGVIPDFKYELSVKDLQNPETLPEYRQAVIAVVEKMI